MIEKLETMGVTEKDIIHFKDGIPGFEEYKDYVLLQEDDVEFIMTMQYIEEDMPSFIVIDPSAFIQNYTPELSEFDKDFFDGETDLKYLLMTIIPKDMNDTVVNLKAPIVINPKTNKAKQVILENKDYPVRCRLFNV